MSKQRRSFTTEFKREAANLVIEQGYSLSDASMAVGVGETALRRWVSQLKSEYQGITPSGSKALTPEQQRIQELESQVKRIEREKEILKKATALLMSDSMKSLI